MEISIRHAQERDIPRIGDLLLQVHEVHRQGRPDIFTKGGRKYTDGQLLLLLKDETRPIFVAVDPDENVVGYSFCVLLRGDGQNQLPTETLYIDDLCVEETLRHQHIGRKLFDYVRDYARELGCYNLTLNVWACNPSAMAFYEGLGMQMMKKEMETIL